MNKSQLRSNLTNVRPCGARSKRSGKSCRQPGSVKNGRCRFHGGLSTGPKTEDGRQRISASRTIHGRYSKKQKQAREALKVVDKAIQSYDHLTSREIGVLELSKGLETLNAIRSVLYGIITAEDTPPNIKLKAIVKSNTIELMIYDLVDKTCLARDPAFIRMKELLTKKQATEFEMVEHTLTRYMLFGGFDGKIDDENGILNSALTGLFSDLLCDDWQFKVKIRLQALEDDVRERCKLPKKVWNQLTPAQREEEFITQVLIDVADEAAVKEA